MKDGHMMEDNEEEEETPQDDTNTKTSCGWFNSIVPDTEGNAKAQGEQTEMIEIPPEFTGERLNMEGGEVTEAPCEELETIRQSENEAENIVTDLIDIVITDM